MKPLLQFSFITPAGMYVYVDKATRQVTEGYNPVYLAYDPKDWKDIEIKIKRDLKTAGLFRTYTFPIHFAGDGRKIIQHWFYTYGYTAQLKLNIERLNHTTQQYDAYLSGDVDFMQFQDSKDEFCVQVNLMDKTVADFIKSVEDIDYEIPLNDPDALTVVMDGIELRNHATWIVTDGTNISNNPTGAHVWDTILASVDSLNKADVQDVPWTNWTSSTNFPKDKWIYKASTNRQVEFRWDVTIDFTLLTGASYLFNRPVIQLMKANAAGTTSEVHRLLDLSAIDEGVFLNNNYHLTGSILVTPDIGDTFFFNSRLFPTPSTTNFINFHYLQGSKIELTYYDRLPATDTKWYRLVHLWQKLLKKASGNKYSLVSNFLSNTSASWSDYVAGLDNIPWDTVISSGDGLRGLANAKIKISLAKLAKFARVRYMIGTSVEGGNLRAEPMTALYQKDNIIATIENVKNFRAYVAADLIASSIKIGYQPQTYDLLNGKNEFNTTVQMKLPTGTGAKDTLDLVSDIRADMYGFEYVRYKAENTETKDTSADSEVFALEIEHMPAGGKYNILRRSGIKQGLTTSSSAFNFGLSPKRCTIANLPYIYSTLPFTHSGVISFVSSAANSELVTFLGVPNPGVYISEKADINVSNFILNPGQVLFKPFYFEFDCEPPETLLADTLANPYGAIRFKWQNQYYKGFIVEVGAKPAKKDLYSWKLVCTADTDLNLLVDA